MFKKVSVVATFLIFSAAVVHAQVVDSDCFRLQSGPAFISASHALVDQTQNHVEIFLAGKLSSSVSNNNCAAQDERVSYCYYYADVAHQTEPKNAAVITRVTTASGKELETLVGDTIPLFIFPGHTGVTCDPHNDPGLRSSFEGSRQFDIRSLEDGTYTVELSVTDSSGDGRTIVSFEIDRGQAAEDTTQAMLWLEKLGSGSVKSTSDPAEQEQIDCSNGCSEDSSEYPLGTVVTLTPTPAPGYYFSGWFGHSDCVDGEVTITASKKCIAAFPAIAGCYTKTEIGTFINGTYVGTDLEPHEIHTGDVVWFDVRPAEYDLYKGTPDTNPAIQGCDISEYEVDRRHQMRFNYPSDGTQTWDVITPWSRFYNSWGFGTSTANGQPLVFRHQYDEPGMYLALSSMTWRSKNPTVHATTSLNARKLFSVTTPMKQNGSIIVESNIPTTYTITGPENIVETASDTKHIYKNIQTPAVYALWPDSVAGHGIPTIAPDRSQVVQDGETAIFTLTYE